MDQRPILVTGASGVLGRAIVTALAEAGLPVRQAVRDLVKARPGVEAVRLNYSEPATISPALKGIGGLLLMAPPLDPSAPAQLGPVVRRAHEGGVPHIVFISAFGVNCNEQAPLRIAEHLVIDSGVPYTILRPNFFMENFSDGFLSGGIKAQNGLFLAAGDGKTSFISVQDIAAVVLAALRTPLVNRELDLTGPEALDHSEAAAMISQVSSRLVTYHSLTEEQMVAGARAAAMPEPAIGYMKVLYGVVRAGHAAAISGHVQEVLGRPPISFRAFAERNAASWSA